MSDGYGGQGAYFGRQLGEYLAPVVRRVPYVGPTLAESLPDMASHLEDRGLNAVQRGLHAYQQRGMDARRTAQDELRDYGTLTNFAGHGQYLGAPIPRASSLVPGAEPGASGPRLQTNQTVDWNSDFSRKPPTIVSAIDETGDLIISHREYLYDVGAGVTGNDFQTVAKLELNPGLSTSFPLLAKFARYFSEYEFTQLVVRFRSLTTPGNSTASGSVLIGTHYNPDAPDYASKRDMENADYTASGKVNDVIVAGVECDGKKMFSGGGLLYTRRGPLGQTNDLHTYDMGKVQIAVAGAQAHQTVGEIWVDYTVRLSKLTNTSLIDPLQIGEGMSVAAFYPGGTQLSVAAQNLFGSVTPESGLMPWKNSWTSTTLGGTLQSPGVFRWGNAATLEQNYNPGQGRKPPVATALRVNTPMIPGFCGSSNLLLKTTSSSNINGVPGPDSCEFTFNTVPGAVYCFSAVIRAQVPMINSDPARGVDSDYPDINVIQAGAGLVLNMYPNETGAPQLGTAVTDPDDKDWGRATFQCVSGPIRLTNGTTETTVAVRPVDGGAYSRGSLNLSVQATVSVTGNVAGMATLRVVYQGSAPHFDFTFESATPRMNGVVLPADGNNLSLPWEATAIMSNFVRVK